MAAAGAASITGVKDWEGGLEDAVAELARAESVVLGGGTSRAGRCYRRAGRVLVACDLLGRRVPAWPIGRQLKSALAASGHSVLGAQMTSLMSPEYALPCGADMVLLKANLRGFYFDKAVTIKVPNPGRATARERFQIEVDLRQKILDTAKVFLPRLVNTEISRDCVFVAEETVGGDELPARLSDEKLATWLLEFYERNGMSASALSGLLDVGAARNAVVSYCRQAGLQLPAAVERWLSAVSAQAMVKAGSVFVATCNGDLTQTNLLKSDGRICIIDWEYIGRSLMCGDVVRLATQRPGFHRDWLKVLEPAVAVGTAGIMPPRDQLLVGALKVAMERINRIDDFANPAGNAEYRKRLKKRIGQILHLCDRLLEMD